MIRNDVVKKDVYNAKINNIEDKIHNITSLATNTTLNAKINELKKEKPGITNLATITALNTKINEVENKIPNINNLATTALIPVENKIPNVSNLVKRKLTITQKLVKLKIKLLLDHDHEEYITTQ